MEPFCVTAVHKNTINDRAKRDREHNIRASHGSKELPYQIAPPSSCAICVGKPWRDQNFDLSNPGTNYTKNTADHIFQNMEMQ